MISNNWFAMAFFVSSILVGCRDEPDTNEVRRAAIAQCTRDETNRAAPQACLQTLLQVAESDLMQSYALRFQDARERDHGSGKEIHADTFRRANDEWKQYRDAECARRLDEVPQGVKRDDYQLACMVELTRRRALDMR